MILLEMKLRWFILSVLATRLLYMTNDLTSLRTAVIFASAVAVVNGFGRFAYALLLPVMRDDLHWDYALSGWLNTANSVGYGVGALVGMLLFVNLVLGVVSRVAPQISVFSVGFPITVTVGLIGMLLTLPLLEQPFAMALQRMLANFQ